MSKNFVQSALARDSAIKLYRMYARAQFWRTGQRVFLNSLPKAGTHLLVAMLQLVPGIMNSRLHVPTREVIRRSPSGAELERSSFIRQLRTIRNGQIATAHLPYLPAIPELLSDQKFAIVNLVRSPRDMLVSRYFYIMGLRRHRLHDHLRLNYADKKSRIMALIVGPKPGEDDFGGLFRPYSELFREFAEWSKCEAVLTLHYEDLVGAKGGGTDERQLVALSVLCKELNLPIGGERLQCEWKSVQNRPSATLRKGHIGDWTNHFDAEIEAAFVRFVEPTAHFSEATPRE